MVMVPETDVGNYVHLHRPAGGPVTPAVGVVKWGRVGWSCIGFVGRGPAEEEKRVSPPALSGPDGWLLLLSCFF